MARERGNFAYIKGTFWKKFPLNLQKFLFILQHCCKKVNVFEGSREAFFKKFPYGSFYMILFFQELQNGVIDKLRLGFVSPVELD